MVGGLEPGGVVDVVGVERDAEEASVGAVDAADARRKAGTRAGGCGAAQSRHLAVDHFDVEVGQFDIVAVGLCVTPDHRTVAPRQLHVLQVYPQGGLEGGARCPHRRI